ncbi:MAG TPA: hypothetical protein VJY66_04945, partial [Acholeplasma sp.]|nr:hypothetical protein [Acholeplasma sp.]
MKTLKTTFNTQVLKTNDIQVEFLKTGDIFKIASSHNQINLLQGNMVDGQFSNLYLRKKTDEGYIFERLLGIHSNAVFSIQNDKAVYQGIALGVSYQVVFSLFNNLWHYDVTLEKTEGMYDLIYGQDVGIASYGSILSSEGYTAQYIDHKAFKNDLGYTVCSRQNQGQPHFLQIGSLNETMSYSTDGFQFFGLSYKQTSVPEILSKDMLKNYNYQYEFPYIALQIKPFLLDENKTFTFYGLYVESHEDVTKEALIVPTFEIFDALIDLEKPYKQPLLINPNNQLQINSVDETYFGDEVKRHKEYKDETLLSFFKDNHKHVILLQKELLVERPHGHLLVHGDLLNATEQVMATTNFMYGVFNSHIVLGNTNFHKLTGDVRNFLNVTKVSGQRMYVDVNGSYQLLGLPSYYELGINYAKWVYVTNQDEIIVTVFAGFNQTQQRTTFESKNNIKYNILVTNQVTMNTNEYEIPLSYDITNDMLRVDVSSNPMVVQHYETLKYLFHAKDASIELADDTFGFDESNSLFVFKYEGKSSFTIDV